MNSSLYSTANSRSANTVTSDATCMSRPATSLGGGVTIGNPVPSTTGESHEIFGSSRFGLFPPPDWVKANTEIPEDVKIGNGTGKARVAYTTDVPPGSFQGDLSKCDSIARTRIVYNPKDLPSEENYLKAESFRIGLDRTIYLWINGDPHDTPQLPEDHKFDLNDPAQFENIENALRSDLKNIIEKNSQATYENYAKVLAEKTNGEEIASDYLDVKYYSFNEYPRVHPRKWKETRYPETGDPPQCPPQTDKEDISADTKASEVGKRVSPDTDNETVNSGVKKMTARELAKL